MRLARALVIVPYLVLATLPLGWLALTSFKSYEDTITAHAKFVPGTEAGGARAEGSVKFTATVDAYRKLSQPVAGTSRGFYHYLGNSVLIGLLSTLAAVCLATLCAYGFSRFRIPGHEGLAVLHSVDAVPAAARRRGAGADHVPALLGLENTHLGSHPALHQLQSLARGLADEGVHRRDPARVRRGGAGRRVPRLVAFVRIIVPQAATGMAVTAVFCLISSWNEFGFAMTLNNYEAKTVPVYFAGLQGNIDGVPWPQIAAGMMIFVAPIVLFTVLVRKHLLRGVTFGTIKQ